MARSSIELLRARTRKLGGSTPSFYPECVLYIMARDQRVHDNHALLAAQAHANELELPLVVAFTVFHHANNYAREQYKFMFDGLAQVSRELQSYNIYFYQKLVTGSVLESCKDLIRQICPAAVYFDVNPLRGPRKLHQQLAGENIVPVYEVDTHNIVPIWELSSKQEFGAYTLRPKMHKAIGEWLEEPDTIKKQSSMYIPKELDVSIQADDILRQLRPNLTKHHFISGEKAAHALLKAFINNGLESYETDRNNALKDAQSNMSPYLHFGQISALRIALTLQTHVQTTEGTDLTLLYSPKLPQAEGKSRLLAGVDALLEEMIIRKELSDNFCFYNDNYDNLDGAPSWARLSLDQHRSDDRAHLYSYEQLEKALTHDDVWNTAQRQLTQTGKMHGYMRMYWAKKVLEWTISPEQAIDFLIRLNDFYSLDGRDPNGYVGILWSIAGLHDRPWFERPIYGKIRYMNHTGIAKRFDIQAYSALYV